MIGYIYLRFFKSYRNAVRTSEIETCGSPHLPSKNKNGCGV